MDVSVNKTRENSITANVMDLGPRVGGCLHLRRGCFTNECDDAIFDNQGFRKVRLRSLAPWRFVRAEELSVAENDWLRSRHDEATAWTMKLE